MATNYLIDGTITTNGIIAIIANGMLRTDFFAARFEISSSSYIVFDGVKIKATYWPCLVSLLTNNIHFLKAEK